MFSRQPFIKANIFRSSHLSSIDTTTSAIPTPTSSYTGTWQKAASHSGSETSRSAGPSFVLRWDPKATHRTHPHIQTLHIPRTQLVEEHRAVSHYPASRQCGPSWRMRMAYAVTHHPSREVKLSLWNNMGRISSSSSTTMRRPRLVVGVEINMSMG